MVQSGKQWMASHNTGKHSRASKDAKATRQNVEMNARPLPSFFRRVKAEVKK